MWVARTAPRVHAASRLPSRCHPEQAVHRHPATPVLLVANRYKAAVVKSKKGRLIRAAYNKLKKSAK